MNEYDLTVVSVAAEIDASERLWQRIRKAAWLYALGRGYDALHLTRCAARAIASLSWTGEKDPKDVEKACWELAICRCTDARRTDGRTFMAMRVYDVLIGRRFYIDGSPFVVVDTQATVDILRDQLREHPERGDEWGMQLLFWPWLDRGLTP